MSRPPGRPKDGSALQAAASQDATLPRSVHARAGGHGAADLGPLAGTARSAEGAPTFLLSVQGLSKRFGGVKATDDVSLDVEPGQVHALLGPNGAGKTSLINQLSGALMPDRGRILFKGQDITRLATHQRVALGLVRSYQITRLFKSMTALDNLALAVQARSGSSFSFWRPVSREKALVEEARALLADVGLANRAATRADQLAHGEQRALEVGLALATRPDLVLLDEPLAGTGPEESERMIELIERLRGRLAILLVEHDVAAVFRLADRLTVLVNGRVIASGDPQRVRVDPAVVAAYLGEELA
jgi:branched-chain amino acid transport system ATP-binding protein